MIDDFDVTNDPAENFYIHCPVHGKVSEDHEPEFCMESSGEDDSSDNW